MRISSTVEDFTASIAHRFMISSSGGFVVAQQHVCTCSGANSLKSGSELALPVRRSSGFRRRILRCVSPPRRCAVGVLTLALACRFGRRWDEQEPEVGAELADGGVEGFDGAGGAGEHDAAFHGGEDECG